MTDEKSKAPVLNINKEVEKIIKDAQAKPADEILKMFIVNRANNNARTLTPTDTTAKMIKSLLSQRSNAYGLTTTVDALENSLLNGTPKDITVTAVFYDGYTVRTLDFKSPLYQKQAEFYRLIDKEKPQEAPYTIEQVINERTRTGTAEKAPDPVTQVNQDLYADL